ncbi:hypothetical protein GJV06_13930 [Enterobacteriaceae bacterium RIT691]|nr:hypothetical protein [Enterobacteriaceae bacterium RIT691]
MEKHIYFVFQPTPILGRFPLPDNGIYSGHVTPENFVNALNREINARHLPWTLTLDNTESDAEELQKRGADVLICAPGLKYRFIRNGFPKHKIIHLEVFPYVALDVDSVIQKLQALLPER